LPLKSVEPLFQMKNGKCEMINGKSS